MVAFYEARQEELSVSSISNLEFPMHLHTLLEMVYVRAGQLIITIDKERFSLSQGDIGLVFPNQIHSYETPDSNTVDLFLFHSSVLGSSAKRIAHCRPTTPVFALHAQSAKLLRELVEEFTTSSPEVSTAMLSLVFARMLDAMSLAAKDSASSDDNTARIVGYLSTHFTQPLSLESIAQELHISKFALSRQFSSSMGMNFRGYLNYLRVDYAKTLLRDNAFPITEIAWECGFQTPRTFNRCFRALMGVTPREYRACAQTNTPKAR